MKVHVLIINNKHGRKASVHASAESVAETLDRYVRERWDSVIDDDMPEDRDNRIETYFDAVDDTSVFSTGGNQHYETYDCELTLEGH